MRVLLMQEDGMWIAQALEIDIAAQGSTIAEAKDAFVRTIAAQVAVALHYNEEPLTSFGRAPQMYWDKFSTAERLAEPIRIQDSVPIPPAFMINAMQKSLAEGWISA